jgi:hypothetical protein
MGLRGLRLGIGVKVSRARLRQLGRRVPGSKTVLCESWVLVPAVPGWKITALHADDGTTHASQLSPKS